MPQYDYIPDYPEQAGSELLPGMFRNAPNMQSFIRGLATGAQEMEDQFFDLAVSTPLDAAYGQGLDFWGQLAGIGRSGLTDNQYRQFIAAQSIAVASLGLPDELVAAGLAMGANEVRTWTLAYQAAVLIELTIFDWPWTDAQLRSARRVFEAARQAGVGPGDGEGMIAGAFGAFRLDDGPGLDTGTLGGSF